jgi:hypothetical protein
VDFALPKSLGGKNSRVSVRRLTAAGAEVRDGIAFAGRTVALDGTISGYETKEPVANGVVNIKASEVVVISVS